jgi:hypothetical protein
MNFRSSSYRIKTELCFEDHGFMITARRAGDIRMKLPPCPQYARFPPWRMMAPVAAKNSPIAPMHCASGPVGAVNPAGVEHDVAP